MRSSGNRSIPGYNPPSNYVSSKKVDVNQINVDFKKYEDPSSKKIKEGNF